jgi:hypothetical protein
MGGSLRIGYRAVIRSPKPGIIEKRLLRSSHTRLASSETIRLTAFICNYIIHWHQSELRLAEHSEIAGARTVEVWYEGQMIGCVGGGWARNSGD